MDDTLAAITSDILDFNRKADHPAVDASPGGIQEMALTDESSGRRVADLIWRYREALDVHSIIAITNRQGRILYANDAFCRISGYSRGELVGKDHSVVNSGYHEAKFFAQMWKTISVGSIWTGDIKNRAKDGNCYWVQTSIVPIRDQKGDISQYLAIRTDITEKVELQEKLAAANSRLMKISEELKAEKSSLNSKNIALNELISHIEEDKSRIKKTIVANIESIIFPLLETMKNSANSLDKKYIDLVYSSLEDISEPFLKSSVRLTSHLTPKELQICNMIKNGLSVKEIAHMLHLSPRTIDKHRENIRRKLEIKSKKINLASYLLNHLG